MTLNSRSTKNVIGSPLFRSSKCGLLYNIFLMISVVIFCYVRLESPKNYSVTENLKSMKFETILNVVQGIVTIISCEFILMTYSLRQDRTIAMANSLNIAKQLANIIDPESSNEMDLLSSSLFTLFCNNVPLCFLFLIYERKEVNDAVLIDVDIFFCYFVINSMLSQYSIAIKGIQHLFKVLNDNLLKFCEQYNGVVSIRSSPPSHLQTEMDKLFHLRNLYSTLSNTSEELSDFYSHSMLLCTGYLFISTILPAYTIANSIFLNQGNLTIVLTFHCSFHIISCGVPLMILTKTITNTIRESKKTGINACCCLGRIDNKRLRRELKSFSNYLLHVNIEFTVFDLFPLDKTLLLLIAGSITTYLVIILQFRDNNHH